MELRQLEHVLAVAEAGSLTRASQRTGLTQQALSKSLARLEEHLGAQLFERTARGMALTRLGETVVEHAHEVVATAARLQAATTAEIARKQDKIVIGLSPIAAATHLGQRVADFVHRRRNVSLKVEGGIDRHFVAELHRGRYDFALATRSELASEDLLMEQVALERWGVAGRRGNPVLGRAKTVGDLARASWVIGANTDLLDEKVERSFNAAGLTRPMPGILTTSVLFALTALSQSGYLAILPRSISETLPNLDWKDLSDGAWTTPVYLMRRKRTHLNAAARALLTEITGRSGF